MKLVNIPNYLDNNVINYIDVMLKTKNENDFNEERFIEWLFDVDVEHKNNPSGYVRSCFKRELEAGRFKPLPKVEYLPDTQNLINEMRLKGIIIMADDSVWLSVLWGYLLNDKGIDLNICEELNHKIVNYMKTNEFSEYKDLVINSNTLKAFNINWQFIEEKTKSEIAKWNDLLNDMELESEE